ncbi:MAG TPA: NAD-dependent epimerase/dehydratase family protein [Geminicoccaceae bacterium]|nr:NAD-dependent epimerase/dehydratase family protein [Geminicoccaceae bacterium]
MRERVLITGGGGFIGSHLADELLAHGHRVRVLDNLAPQVHGGDGARPEYLSDEVEFLDGDVRDGTALRRALIGVDAVYHLASLVGVGQSMYQVDRYVSVNDLGTAVLLQALIERPVARLIVASSMSIYGEGLYRDRQGRPVETAERTAAQLRRGQWEPQGADGAPLRPVATPESKRPAIASVYALTKYTQERMCLIVGQAYDIPTVALRFFNAYGPRQALSNPYTGVLAIFASRLLNGRRPPIFEDGRQVRAFVDVRDVARACRLALESPGAPGRAINVGSGRALTVREVAAMLAEAVDRPDLQPEVTGRFRAGDIRHCYPDVSLARELLGFEAEVRLEDGLAAFAGWLAAQIAIDRVEQATHELASRGLVA